MSGGARPLPPPSARRVGRDERGRRRRRRLPRMKEAGGGALGLGRPGERSLVAAARPVPSRPVPGTAGPRRLLAAPAGGAAPAHLCGGGRGPGRLSRPPPVGGAAGGWFCGGGRDRGRCRWGGTAGTDSPPPPFPGAGLRSGGSPQGWFPSRRRCETRRFPKPRRLGEARQAVQPGPSGTAGSVAAPEAT